MAPSLALADNAGLGTPGPASPPQASVPHHSTHTAPEGVRQALPHSGTPPLLPFLTHIFAEPFA
ncbi:hypothetical protein CLU86_3899 [Acidovorax sp. 62]|uniref:hypothetical protein n=1 Tax=Acidovorax sp. 62 TaxID=2035203 RepID=UPI000C492F34|nr:hypothetical protein [Acidovorax sp. 62]PIF92949.1 hypothetical protein CLU86_3899 [Acidovorax sp. 62]